MSGAKFKGGGFFEKLLRFFNLLEPGHMVLSLSKLSMWGMGVLVVWVVIFHAADLTDVLGALGGFGAAAGNYGYRRHKQYESGNRPYPDNLPRTVDVVADGAQDSALDKL